jgi:glycosyltransferase involved in cell wall biosynthesis
MRIMMVSARYSPVVGGTEAHVEEVSARLAALGHQVTVLTTDSSRTGLAASETARGVQITRVPAWPKGQDFYFSPRIYREVAASQHDIIHFQGYSTLVAPVGMSAAIRGKRPFVLTFHSGGHSSRLRNSIRGVQHTALSPLVRKANRLIGVSDHEAAFFSKHMRINAERFTVIPNGASLPPPSDPRPEVEPHLVLSVGRLERYKGHHRVIKAFPELLQRIPDARLMIVGSGPYERELRKLVWDLRLSNYVLFTSIPFGERRRFTDLLCMAGLVVLLSDYEAHPVAVMEALSVGRPVLVGDTSGLRELARRGFCHSVPLDNSPQENAEAIAIELHSQRPPPAVSLPNWDDCAQQLLQIYKGVLA